MKLAGFKRVEGRPIRIGVVEKNDNPYWDTVNAGFADAATRLGLEVQITAPQYEDVEEQIELLHRHLESGVDAIAFVASDANAFTGLVGEAHSRGVPAVNFDLDAPDSGRCFYYGMQAPIESGRHAGRLMMDILKGRGKVAVQTGSERAQGAVGKLKGFTEVMQQNGIEVVGGDNDSEHVDRAYENACALLRGHPDLDGIYGVYAYHPAVQARAVEELRPKKRPVIVGFDMLPETVDYLERGLVDASIWIREYYFGYHTASAVACLLRLGAHEAFEMLGMNAEDLSVNRRLVPVRAITGQTVGKYRDWAAATGVKTRLSGLHALAHGK